MLAADYFDYSHAPSPLLGTSIVRRNEILITLWI